jgi:hypothetical protein
MAFHGARCIAQATASHGIKPGCRVRLWYWLDRPTTGGEAFAQVRHLSAQIVAACQRNGLPAPESMTWHALSRRLGYLLGDALRAIASTPNALGYLAWRLRPSAQVVPSAVEDWVAAEQTETSDVEAILKRGTQ